MHAWVHLQEKGEVEKEKITKADKLCLGFCQHRSTQKEFDFYP